MLTDVFTIPVGEEFGLTDGLEVNIVYSPLSGEIYFCHREELPEVLKEISSEDLKPDGHIPSIKEYTKLSLIPNLICNFSCSYCYSAEGRTNGKVIRWPVVKSAFDYFIDENRISPQPLSIFISGGGEPLLSWDQIVRPAIEYAKERAGLKGFALHVAMITNGSLITEDVAAFCKENNVSVGVSFEVLKELQELQRAQYERVHNNIRLLYEHGVRVLINSTITPASVDRMADMAMTVMREYPYVAQYTVEPVTSAGLFENAAALRDFYSRFYGNYLLAKKDCPVLRFTFEDSLEEITYRHCPGKLCVTPSGDISICHLCSSEKEQRWERCMYGKVEESGKVYMDVLKWGSLYAYNVGYYQECRDCFAKYSCGGECLARRDTYPPDYMAEVCNFNRRFVRHLLLRQIESQVLEETGKTLIDYVREDKENIHG